MWLLGRTRVEHETHEVKLGYTLRRGDENRVRQHRSVENSRKVLKGNSLRLAPAEEIRDFCKNDGIVEPISGILDSV